MSHDQRADAHIHLFEGGYQGGSFTSRPGVQVDEVLCYQSLMKDHQIETALVVGFEGEEWCFQNNDFLARLISHHSWIQALAFCHLDQQADLMAKLEKWKMQGFKGISLYLLDEADYRKLMEIPAEFWEWLTRHGWLISVNSLGSLWKSWKNVLEKHPMLKLIVSHLGLPGKWIKPPSEHEASAIMKPLTDLAEYSEVHVKLSGFYALTEPAYDYPHPAAWPLTNELARSFGTERLLWGSDFSPSLDYLSFPQTFDLFEKMPFLKEEEIKTIQGENLLHLLQKGEW